MSERSEERLGYANGFKPKTVATRLGSLTFEVPQVRGDLEFYPSALEKGLRSERALKLAIAEMYLQGVSTRKVTAVLEKMCGLQITSSQVSRATAELDVILQQWRERPLSSMRYLILDGEPSRFRPLVTRRPQDIAIRGAREPRRDAQGVARFAQASLE